MASWHVVANERGILALRALKGGSKRVSRTRGASSPDLWRRRVEGELRDYFAGKSSRFTTPYDIRGLPPFTRAVLRLTARIPYGQVRTYKWLAAKLGNPRAARAVGNALARNPIPIIIPCHRVVRQDGSMGPFVFGSRCKKKLLSLEKRFENQQLPFVRRTSI